MAEQIRDFRPGEDDAGVKDLWERVFGAARGGQTVDWLFRPGPAGPSPRSVVEADGRIVAHAGAAAIRFRIAGEDVRGAYSVGAMTDAAHRGRGLWAQMGRHLYARLEREGFAFVAGFSNAASHRLMTGPLGRTPLRPFPWCVRPLSPVGYLRSLLAGGAAPSARVELRGERGVCVREVDPGDSRLDAVWERSADVDPIGCVRDAAFTRWRYASRPEAGYRILLAEARDAPVGFAVLRTFSLRGVRAGFLLDFILAPGADTAGRVLLRACAGLAKAEGAVLMSALLPGAGPARAALQGAGYVRIPERLHPQVIRFSVRGFGRFARSTVLTDPASWHLSWADTDVV